MNNLKLEIVRNDKLYKLFIILTGAFALFYFGRMSVVTELWQELALFLVLLIISDLSSIKLPSGIDFSVGFIMELTIIQVFGVDVASVSIFVAAITSYSFGMIIGNKMRSLINGLQEVAVRVVTVVSASLVYNLANDPVSGFVLASLSYFVLNVTLMALAQYMSSQNEDLFRHQWLEFGKEISLNYFVLAPLAYLIPYVFSINQNHNKLLFVLLFFVPVMLVIYSYRLYVNIRQSYLNTVKTMVAAIEAKDPYVKGHADRVADYALAIARDMDYSDKELTRLQYIALLHDAGKIGVRDYILNKPDSLTIEEYGSVKEHSVIGEQIVKKIKFLSGAADMVRYHHERFDGTGYPEGLKGYDIPEGARILAVVDAFDAMTTDRPYRKARTRLSALAEIDELAGLQFDPRIVDVFKRVLFRQGEI